MATAAPPNLEFHKSEMDLFSPAIVQSSIDEGTWENIQPTGFNGQSGPLQFDFTAENEYIDFNNTYLTLKVAVYDSRPNQRQLPAQAQVALANNYLHTLFSSVTMQLNGANITAGHSNYPYRAYLETLLSYGSDAKRTYLQGEGYYADTAGHFPERADANKGYKRRKALVARSKVVGLKGRIHLDMFHQPQLLLNKVPVRITLNRSSSAFNLMGNEPNANSAHDYEKVTFAVEILSAHLEVRKVHPSPSIALQHVQALETTTAKYPIKRVVVKTCTIDAGRQDETVRDLFTGQLPQRLILGLVPNTAYNGSLEHNPFEFKHYNLKNLQLVVANKAVPMTPMTFDFENDDYMDGYFSLFGQTGQYGSDEGNGISRDEYNQGFAIYCFNLGADLNLEEEHFNGTNKGNVTITMGFSANLPETVTLVAFAEFENTIEINRYREVALDYAA